MALPGRAPIAACTDPNQLWPQDFWTMTGVSLGEVGVAGKDGA